MPVVNLHIPQIGEGLQEARVVAFLKQPGDHVRRDEPIYQMETDKAIMDVESPFEGALVAWTVRVDTVLPIGAEIATMEVADGVGAALAPSHGPAPVSDPELSLASSMSTPSAPAPAARRTDIPPRTRAYAKEKGISEQALATISASGGKLMPADIDAFLASGAKAAATSAPSSWKFAETAMGGKQRLLSSRLVRGSQLVVPGTITVAAVWEAIEELRARTKSAGGEFQPSSFTMFAYAVVQALREFPSFRSSLVGDSVIRTYNHVHLGIAVALPGDELALAVVDEADLLSWPDFAQKTRDQVELARTGKDQAHEAVTLSLTNMQAFGLRDAVPVVAPPAVGTLFLGATYNGLDQTDSDIKLRRFVNLALTFDHRLINGVGASEFINCVKANVEGITNLIKT